MRYVRRSDVTVLQRESVRDRELCIRVRMYTGRSERECMCSDVHSSERQRESEGKTIYL